MKCLQANDECNGEVTMSSAGRRDGKAFPRCEFHLHKRIETEQRIRQYEAPCAPSDFSAGEHWGEHWDEDY